jgi:glycine oxidase
VADSASRHQNVETKTFDVAVVGDGIIGRSVALELCRAGASCVIVGTAHAGAGWRAAAGILAPSVGERDPDVRAIFRRSLDLYPAFLERLRPFDPGLSLVEGLLEVRSTLDVGTLGPDSILLDESEVRRREPALLAPFGAVLHRRDAAADSERIVAALERALSAEQLVVEIRDDAAASMDLDRMPPSVTTVSGQTLHAQSIVLAAGAWTPTLRGLPRPIPIFPLKGQIIALDAPGVISRPIMASHTYFVPRGRELVVGATQEDAGFDVEATEEAARSLQADAARYCPGLANVPITRHWAGLRPATPDLLPILGPEPLVASLVYACGHSRNGILLAPLTAVLIRDCIARPGSKDPAAERFTVTRFS